jgi:hypothetical protein
VLLLLILLLVFKHVGVPGALYAHLRRRRSQESRPR